MRIVFSKAAMCIRSFFNPMRYPHLIHLVERLAYLESL